jgi:CRP/FNR family transcriptional regulator, cyclic AMP receptor protein
MDKSSTLRQLPVFSALKDRDLKALSDGITEARYEKGQYIFKQGDPADCFHVLMSGAVKCVQSSQAGKEAVLKVLLPGDLFCCEAAVFDGKAHPGCAQPMGPVAVLKIPKHAYLKLLKTNPTAALEVIKYLGGRLNEAQETSKTFALERADQRIAALLTRFAERIGRPSSEGIVLGLRISRQDIADMTGLAVETTIRTISKLTRKRLIAKSGRSLVIRDLRGLQALAEEPSH